MLSIRTFFRDHIAHRAQRTDSDAPDPALPVLVNQPGTQTEDLNSNEPMSATPGAFTSDTARVYVSYDIADPPPHPGDRWTRFVCISDTHSRRYSVPPGDVLLHSGDLSSWGQLAQLRKTVDWIKTLPHPTKV